MRKYVFELKQSDYIECFGIKVYKLMTKTK